MWNLITSKMIMIFLMFSHEFFKRKTEVHWVEFNDEDVKRLTVDTTVPTGVWTLKRCL